jgi:hypothetical protein
MTSTLPALRLALIGLAVASAFGASSANAQTPAPAGTPSDSARPRGPGAGGPQLFTKEERDAMREKMRSAKSPEDHQKLRGEYRAELERRAKEKGVTLPPQRADGRQGGGHAQAGKGGQRGDHPARNLMSDAERQQFRDKMHTAKTPEERQQARNDMRATLEQRAKEKGVTLPEQRGRHGHGGQGGHGGRGPRSGAQGTSQS